jgi:hypothetical protein
MTAPIASRLRSARTLTAPHPATWLALLVPVFAWAQLSYPGYLELHSGFLPIFNVNDLFHHLGDLAWAPMIGQPYDLLRGEGALPYRLAAVTGLLGFPSATAVKCIFAAGILAGALGMYGWARRRLGPWPALLAEAVYVFWPVVLATVYVRGALAETALLGLTPWVLWAADAAVAPGRKKAGLTLALVLAATFWTQTGLALWLAPVVLGYILVLAYAGANPRTGATRRSVGNGDKPAARPARAERAGEASIPTAEPEPAPKQRRAAPAVALLGWAGGAVLGVLGLLPLLLRHGVGGGTPVVFADHFVYPHQLLLSGWGVGPSIPGPYDTLTFDIGAVAFGLALLSVLPMADAPPRDGDRGSAPLESRAGIRATQYAAAGFVLLLILLSTTLAAGAWGLLGGLARTLTYPWQLLLLAGPWLAWMAGAGGRALADLFSRAPEPSSGAAKDVLLASLFGALITLVLISSYGNLNPTVAASPPAGLPVAIFGDNQIALLDAKVSGTPGPGGRVVVSTEWQALRALDQDYTMFVHAVTPDGTRWAQADTMPQGGKLPTSLWRPGQVVTDTYTLNFAPDAPAGQGYRYLMGLYLWQTGQRLPAAVVEGPPQGDDTVSVGP